jgi:hypothetical protein
MRPILELKARAQNGDHNAADQLAAIMAANPDLVDVINATPASSVYYAEAPRAEVELNGGYNAEQGVWGNDNSETGAVQKPLIRPRVPVKGTPDPYAPLRVSLKAIFGLR